jgi:hypothetical protein
MHKHGEGVELKSSHGEMLKVPTKANQRINLQHEMPQMERNGFS